MDVLQPEGWAAPRGYSNGIAVDGPGRHVFVAGQIAWNERAELVGRGDLAAQFDRALGNVVAVLAAGGARPEHVCRMTVYVTDKRAYLERVEDVGAAWREHMGRHYPAMALVQVADLLEDGALVEIEATAFVPAGSATLRP